MAVARRHADVGQGGAARRWRYLLHQGRDDDGGERTAVFESVALYPYGLQRQHNAAKLLARSKQSRSHHVVLCVVARGIRLAALHNLRSREVDVGQLPIGGMVFIVAPCHVAQRAQVVAVQCSCYGYGGVVIFVVAHQLGELSRLADGGGR